ncbi:hypothetical protein [Aliikangiella coralliicola]|uniref:PKD domain-containing protein n=1 Tax=Aliikangiella coralliicola TaxID=2592383 RepID=A0A545UD86_9GAMM|nr:hypothetical protein [Aliikangiella coralliicola]TQV87429.1 hypothetical protein FLL46_13375 [Aliikangiella coralliicola]
MDICRAYPKFEADQVLTADQLNKLFSYLDLQNRWTRKCFIGAGIACGLRLEINEANSTVFISAGCGLTTHGYQISYPDSICTHYAEYTDPVQYSYFRRNDAQVKLWELLPKGSFDTEDPDNKPIPISFLKDKVALLYLEVRDVDLDTCTGSDCDEKGMESTLCVRFLLIEKSVLDLLIKQNSSTQVEPLYDMYLKKYDLPCLNVGRLHWLGDEDTLLELEDIQLSYAYLLSSGTLLQMEQAFREAYQIYLPLLQDDYAVNPFKSWVPKLNHPLGIQYFYDHIKDLILAYQEFIEYAFDVFVSCCVPENAFPKHLMVRELYPTEDCKPSAYRHYFITAMEPTAGEYKVRKVKSLFKRLVLLSQSFRIPDLKSSLIKITPSHEKETPLGQRSIPYYYDLNKYPQLRSVWNFDLAERCLSDKVLSYHDNECIPVCESKLKRKSFGFLKTVKSTKSIRNSYKELDYFYSKHAEGFLPKKSITNTPLLATLIDKHAQYKNFSRVRFPLDGDLNEFPFYRIEGPLGKDYNEASLEVLQWIKCYNLPIKLMGLKVGKISDDINLTIDCRFEDIELVYLSQREKINCYFNQTLELVRSIKFDAPEDDLEESPVSKVVGRFIDGRRKTPLAGVYYGIQKLKLVGETDTSGVMELSNLPPGKYSLETFFKGYGSKSVKISVKQGKTLKLGDMELFQDALLDEKEIFYKDKTSEKEARRKVEELEFEEKAPFEVKVESGREKEDSGKFPISYRYDEFAGERAGESKYLTTRSAGENIKFTEKGYAAEVAEESPYEIGTIFEDFKISESKDIYTSAKLYLYRNFAKTNVKETDDILDKIYQPLQIVTTLNTLISELKKPLLQFDKTYFTSKYEQLLSQVEKFKDIITGNKYGELFSQTDKENIIRYFNLLRQENCFNQFQSLMEAYDARTNKIQLLHLLSAYSGKTPGMFHVGGCWAGGTYFLIYDNTRRIVLDFALPFICCSDCPPIQFCSGYPVIFKLPQTHFCKTDARLFKFITNYPGGQTVGKGVITDETTGEHFFKPSADDVTAGTILFSYFINEARYDFSVSVADPQVAINYNLIEVDNDAQTATVQFSSDPKEAQEYLWDFGDGDISDNSTSKEPSPVKTYDLSQVTAYTVTLQAKQGQCFAHASHELTFEMCNATFTYREIERSLNSITYQFTHPQASLTRVWEMGDGNTVNELETFTHIYELGEAEQEITVTLTMTQETCSDTKSVTFTIPAYREVTIFMDSYSLCRNGTPAKVTFDPKNGTYTGNGLVVEDGEVHFHPGHPDVVVGSNEITYEFEGEKVSQIVTVSTIEGEFAATVKLINGEAMKADVQFSAPENLDSYSYDLGDGNSSTEPSFLHTYDLNAQTNFDVQVRLINGACDVTQSTSLDLTPCSAEFTYRELTNDGETIVIEYTMLDRNGKLYQLEDELGVVKSSVNIIRRTYKLGGAEREMPVTMRLNKPPCINSFSSMVTIPASIPLNISMEVTQFVWCDKNRYPITISPKGTKGIASGPGVRTEGNEIFFIPALANIGGDVTITFTAENRSASLTVNVKKPTASLEIKSIKKVDNGIYDVAVINNSTDYNLSKWVFTPGGTSLENEPTFRLVEVKPNQPITVTVTVSWDEQCPNTSPVKTFRIPVDIIAIDDLGIRVDRVIDDFNGVRNDTGFIKVFPEDNTLTKNTASVYDKLRTDLSDPDTSKEYVAGLRNQEISETFDPLITKTRDQLSTTILEADAETAQAGYPMLLSQISQVTELVNVMEKDLKDSDPMSNTLNVITQSLAALSESGIEINPDDQLRKVIDTAMEANANKPNTVKSLSRINQLLG